MRDSHAQPSLCRRVLRMSLTWLFLGAVSGVVLENGTHRVTEIVSMMLGGMIVLPIPGVFLGLIGGDARGSVVGAAGALLGCWFSELCSGVAVPPIAMTAFVIFGGLFGATGLLFARFWIWKYGMIFRTLAWLSGATAMLRKASSVGAHLLTAHSLAAGSVHIETPPDVTRARTGEVHPL